MDQRIFHGKITPRDIAQSLIGHFNRGNLRVQQVGDGPSIIVQIATTNSPSSGGQTALTIQIQTVEDGISVQVGQQSFLGVAASLGFSAFAALRNPINLLNRLDDIAQDIENLQLSDEVWKVINDTARILGTNFQLSENLRRLVCEFCDTANLVGESHCIACGAPLGQLQPSTCSKCGFIVQSGQKFCPNCRSVLLA